MSILQKCALKWAMRKPAPNSIPLSNRKKLRERNYYSVELKSDRPFVCHSLTEDGITGLWIRHVPNGVEHTQDTISLDAASNMDMEIRQYLREIEYRYRSASAFLFHHIFFIPLFSLWHRRFEAALFKTRRLARKDQLEILSFLAERARRGDIEPISSSQMISELYGMYIWEHPERELIRQHYQLWLTALEESGDAIREQTRFRISGKGLNTLAAEERDDRRHQDSVNTQRAIVFLTFVLVIVSIFNSIVTFLNDY